MRNTDRLYKIIQEFMTNDRRHVSKRRVFVRALSIFVVFVMTYMLVLPAFTLDEKSAVEQGGIDVPSAAVQEEEKSEPADVEEKADSSDQSDKTDEEAADKEDSNKEDGDKQDADSSQADADDKKDEPAAASEDEDKDDSEEKDEEEAKEPLSELVFKGDGYTVTVTTKGEKFPADTELKVKEIERKDNTKLYDSYEKSAKEAIKDEDEVSYSPELAFAKFYDITMYSDGSEYEPKSPVEVNITYDKALQKNLKAEKSENVRVIHFANDENDGKVTIGGNKVTPEVIANKDIDVTINKDKMTEATFAAETFSVYAVVYTVDFHWGVNGKQFDFGIPGGGVITLGQIAEAFGIGTDRDAQGTDGAESITVSDDTKEFLENVERVEFSDPELIWTGKADEDTTAGDLIKANGLKPEFSADLTAAQKKAVEDRAIDKGDWALISLKPFITEETLTIVMNNGETFVVKVTDGQIKRTIMTANGETYEITVAYDEDAEIPAGAELKVEEILPDDERYPEYYKQSLEAAGISLPEEGTMAGTLEDAVDSITDAVAEADPDLAEAQEAVQAEREYARVFDIEIQADGQKVEPKADVYTSIKLLDAPSSVETDLKVVHFAGAGTELMDAEVNDGETAGEAELNFTTNEFSVYTVVNANGSTNLDGQTFALVSGIAEDNGEAGWWEDGWKTTDYYTQVVNAHAMTDEELTIELWKDENGTSTYGVKGIGSVGVHAWTEGSNSYVGGDVPEYHFESVGNNKYIIYVVKNGTNYYIDQYDDNQETVSLSPNRSWATKFSVDANSDGTVLIHNGGWYLHNTSDVKVSGFDEWRSRNYTMTWNNSTPTGNEYKFKLCKKSDDYDSYAAKKVSVQDVDSTKTVIIYRKIVEEDGTEHLYAVAHDGSLFRIYDGGDSVYWRETEKKLHWVVDTVEGKTYVHSPESEGTPVVYISPFKTTDQIISTNQTSVYLTGKTDGKYGSPIEVWDQEAYDYAGLHVNESGSSVVLQTGTRVSGTSDEFLFAEVSSMPPAEKTLVDTVDSEKLGVHITVFDYGKVGHEYNAGDKLPDMTGIVGSEAYTPHGAQALVTPYLSALNNGVPVSSSAGAMDGLFKDDSVASIDGAATYVKSGVTNLFLASYYNESGMFRYRSEDNYAYLGRDGETSFKVYQQVGSPYPTENVIGHPYYYHGHYMPFNDLDTSQVTSRLVDQYGTSELDLGDGRTYEDVYGVEGVPNYYTGMKIEADFTQPRNGQLENGDDMIFKFTGDDDMWVYIDGVLVLDIGGIHEPLSGTINFRTGKVTNPAGSSLAGTKTLYEIFMATRNNPNTPQEIKDKIDSIQWKDVDGNGTPDTFADYGNHSFGAFYMERGAGASNLDIAFNLKTVLTDQFTVGKELPEDIDTRFVNQKYRFQATFIDDTDGNTEKPLYQGAKKKDGTAVCTKVTYQGRKGPDGQPIDVYVDVDNYGYFYLNAGEVAVFKMSDDGIKYNVKEVDVDQYHLERITINGEETDHVDINDDPTVVTNNAAVAGAAAVRDRSSVLYTNYPKTQALKITKHIIGDIEEDTNPVFEFHVYLETIEKDDQGNEKHILIPYSHGPYYLVKAAEPGEVLHYYQLTGKDAEHGWTNMPVDMGTDPVVCSETGSSGSISRIPPEYTIIIPDILDGTHFYLTERLDNLPEGYSFVREELKDGTYDPCTLDPIEVRHQLASDETEVSDTYDPETIGKIKDGVDAESHIYNRHGIVATKKWQDAYGNDLDSRNNPLWEANVTFKLRKKTVTETDDGEEVTYSDVYSDPTDKPQYYKDHHLNWSDTQTVTSVTGEAKWENLDRLGENESYVIIEQAIEGVAEKDIVRDEQSGAIKSFKLNGKVFNTIDGVLPEEGGTTINKEQPLTDIEVQKIWSTPEGMDPGTATMVLYQAVGNKDLEEGEIDPAKPSRKIRVTIDASLISETTGEAAGTTKSAYIEIAYTGTDSGTYRLNNQNGWKHTFEFDRGGVYNFTYTPDGNKVKTVDPSESADISTSMTIPLQATVADMTQHTYTFTVPASERPEKGSITVTCNGTEKIAGPTNNWTVDFTVADEEAVTYSAEADGKFITDVTLDPEAASGETATANKNVSMHPTAAPLTLTVPVTVNWDKEPPEGTEVTVTLTPDKSGVEPKTVSLTASNATSGTQWKAADQTLDRLDNNGDLITWTVTTAATSAANNVSVALSSLAGAKISDTASDVVVDGSVAPTTMTVPVSVNWGTETPDAGTTVTVTFTNGGSTETVELDGTVDGTETSAWHANKELPRLDANGNLLTWTVSTSVGPEGTSASVSGAPASVSDPDGDSQAGPVELTGTVARKMNLTIKVPSNTFANFGEFFLVDSNKVRSSDNLSGFDLGYIAGDYSKTYSNLEVKDSSGNDIYYAIKLWNPPYKVTTNASEAGTGRDNGNTFLWIKAQSGDVTIQLENISQTPGNPDWQIITGQSMNSASGLRKAAARSMMKARAKAPAKAASQGSPIQTFYDPAVNTSEEATGKVPFTKVEFKDLPEGATIVDVDGEDESGTQTVTGNSTFKWQNLPTMDADGNPIYYYIVEKDATAQADTMNVKYEYEYNDDGSISKVKITNTTTGTPTPQTGDITITKSFSGVDALPTGFKITNSYDNQVFTVQNATGTNPYTWTLSGIPDETVVTFTESGATVNGYDLTVTSSGTVIADSKVSATVIAGSTVTTGFVNTYEEKTTTVTLKKVDKSKINKVPLEASDLLDGATFVLKKYEQLSPEKEDTTWNTAHATPNTGESGVFTFSDLTPGTYKIVETEYPSGYVKLSSDPIFRVVVDEETGDLEIEPVDSADGMVRLVDGEMTIVVGNEPGKPLPNSGGPGTTLFYIFGSILLLGSVIVLAGRARSAKN